MWVLNSKKGLIVKSLFIVVVILILAGLYIVLFKETTGPDNPKLAPKVVKSLGATPSVVEKTVATPIKTALSNSDYATYQNLQRTIALQYLYNTDTINAERIMNEVVKNVPAAKVASSSYLTMASIQAKKHDIAQQKKYLQLAIDKLNVEGNPQQAASEQKELDGLQ